MSTDGRDTFEAPSATPGSVPVIHLSDDDLLIVVPDDGGLPEVRGPDSELQTLFSGGFDPISEPVRSQPSSDSLSLKALFAGGFSEFTEIDEA